MERMPHLLVEIRIFTWWRHQMETVSRYWPFVRGIQRSPQKGQWRGALMFSLICVCINGCVNNRGAGIWDAIAPIMTSLKCKDICKNSTLINSIGLWCFWHLIVSVLCTVYPKKYAHGFCFAVLCCSYTLTDFPISIRLTSLALWQSSDCPSASKSTLMNMDKYFMWIHYERLHNHNKAKHNKTVCIFLGIYCTGDDIHFIIDACKGG